MERPNFTILAGSDLTSEQSVEIIRRWDSHEALLEACKELVEHADIDDVIAPFDAVFPYDKNSQSEELSRAIAKAKQAIKQAEGK